MTPPSTGMAAPVMNDESDEQRKAITAATSSGSPKRPRGSLASMAEPIAVHSAASVSAVLVGPGHTAFTLMLRCPRSSAAALLRFTAAPLDAL